MFLTKKWINIDIYVLGKVNEVNTYLYVSDKAAGVK
jgi:hypothetical protein